MDMITVQIEIFIIAAIGYYLGLRKTLDPMTRGKLVDVLINVVLSASVVSSFQMKLTPETLQMTLAVFLISCGLQVFYAIWNHLFFKTTSEGHRACLKYGIMVSNAGIIGMPIAQAYFGTEGLLCASIFLLPQRVLMWTYGVSMFSGTSDRHVVRRLMTNPCVVAIFVGFGVMALETMGIELPSFISGTLGALGDCSMALSMLIVGAIVSECPLREMLNREALVFSLQRLIIIPVLVGIVLRFLPIDTLSIEVCVLLSAMPAASTTAMLAERYHADSHFASQLVMTSTALSLFTIPAVTIGMRLIFGA